jgi:ABC-type antimicrobial peptide transport system permease subunit
MLKNYILTALRSIKKNFVYAGINVLGLSLAIAVCITAFLSNKWNWDFNKVHENNEDIYKINVTRKINKRNQKYAFCPVPIGNNIQEDIPQVDRVVNFCRLYLPVKKGGKVFNQRIGFTNKSFIDVFNLNMVSGDKEMLGEKNKILISKQMANKLFSDEDPVGEVLSVVDEENTEHTFIVGGIFSEYPRNTSFFFDALTSIDNYFKIKEIEKKGWHQYFDASFLYIKNREQVRKVEELLEDYIPIQNNARKEWKIHDINIDPFKTIHKTTRKYRKRVFRHGQNPAQIKVAPVMALFILLIACFNFINTSIAFAGKRLKEIGIRKTFGAGKRQLIFQFLMENFILTLLAISLGLYLAIYFLEAYSQMWSYMDLNLMLQNNPQLIIFLVGLLLITTLLAGGYPALYISSFSPIGIFRSKIKLGDHNILSKALLTIQFFISIMVLFLGVVFAQNAEYQKNMDLGYNKENIMLLNLNDNNDYKAFEQVVKKNPKIIAHSGTYSHIGFGGIFSNMISYREQKKETQIMKVGINYLKLMGVKLKKGRLFKPEFENTDISNNSIIVNEKFVKAFGLDNPVNKSVYLDDTTQMHIIGVIEDVHLTGPWYPVKPLAFRLTGESNYKRFILKVKDENKEEVDHYLEKKWKNILPNKPYNGTFHEQLVLDQAIKVNRNGRNIMIFLAIVASVLTSAGLFSLVSLRIISKTKEIAIRKIMGANIPIIMKKISKPYIIILVISIVIGLTGGYFISKMIMSNIWSEHVTPNLLSFLMPLFLILIVAMGTVTGKIYRAAIKNPSDSIRDE